GSLASGTGDDFSDVDLRLAVEPATLGDWTDPDWDRYLPIMPSGSTLMRFGEQALLHHMILSDGAILDFFVQDTARDNFEPTITVIFCRDADFQKKLEGFSRPAAPLIQEIDGATARRFLVDYWITTFKEMKAIARQYDYSDFVGLYLERLALLRGWMMFFVGKDIGSRPTLHVLDKLHKELNGKLTQQQHDILGMPTRNPTETVAAIEAIRSEMAQIGRTLAERHGFDYPIELEEVVHNIWAKNKDEIVKR
ncbi:MAG: hypothetical protein AAF902_21170, partial [Chloroflexota bacterium]